MEWELNSACLSRQYDKIKQLLAAGANANTANSWGHTRLHDAALLDHDTTADIFIKAGAHVDARTNAGNTPLHIAAWRDSKKTALVLLKAGASTGLINCAGQKPSDTGTLCAGIIKDFVSKQLHALALGLHTRLGADSPLRHADQLVLRTIAAHLL